MSRVRSQSTPYPERDTSGSKIRDKSGAVTLSSKSQMEGRSSFAVLASIVLAMAVPFAAYVQAPRYGIDLATPIFVIVALVLAANAMFPLLQGILDLAARPAPPGSNRYPSGATAVIMAELPDDEAALPASINALLDLHFPLQVVLACGTPETQKLGVELRKAIRDNWRVTMVRVEPRSSPEKKMAAVLHKVQGEFVAIFEADQWPASDAFHQAWQWLSDGYSTVRGRRTVRNRRDSWVTRLMAVEWSVDTNLPLPSWGWLRGPNSYWNTSDLQRNLTHGGDPRGNKIAHDRKLITLDPAPATLASRWRARMGEDRVQARTSFFGALRQATRSGLSAAQRVQSLERGLWRPSYVWLAAQALPLVAYFAWKGDSAYQHSLLLIGVLILLYLLSSGPTRAMSAFALASDVRHHPRSFAGYLAASSVLFSPLDNLAARVAQLKVAFGRRTRSSSHARADFSHRPRSRKLPIAEESYPSHQEANTMNDNNHPTDESSQGANTMAEQYPTVDNPWTRDMSDVQVADRPHPSDVVDSALPPSASKDAATGVLERAQELVGLVRGLMRQVEGLETERDSVQRKVEELDSEISEQLSFRKALLAGPATSVNSGDLRALQGLVDSLVREPYHIGVLAQIGGHATALSSVVNGYAQMRSMLETEQVGSETEETGPQSDIPTVNED